ncbi:hypothetical protein B0H21DRAFT_353427 [Amylocystis lapponica]|nr:hypothetical protein B0H21DRAFT_353427 [Amylocystis lapponica]
MSSPIKHEHIEEHMHRALRRSTATHPRQMEIKHKIYRSSQEIIYTPEDALTQGVSIVKAIEESIARLHITNVLRRKVWEHEIQRQGAPTTIIAVCGATGAGKSSLLNAVLGDNIVPTSGSQACTAVVTEIGYHAKATIDAIVSFLPEVEWKRELTILLEDLTDENVRKVTGRKSGVDVTLNKIQAVYPSIPHAKLAEMSTDEIISHSPEIKALLGTKQHISAVNSSTFGKEIAEYIDSKGQNSGQEKEKAAWWPLIAKVQVFCSSPALSTGAILVDLPGVADVNSARDKIANGYLEKCDCVWILAPITRAIDDKAAKNLMNDAFKAQLMMDGLYDGSTITFIATKCDDVHSEEIINDLGLKKDPKLEKILQYLLHCDGKIQKWLKKKQEVESEIEGNDKEHNCLKNHLKQYKAQLTALENGEDLAVAFFDESVIQKFSSNKRKHAAGGQDSRKKMKSGSVDDEETSSSDNDTTSISSLTTDPEDTAEEKTDDAGQRLRIKIETMESSLQMLLQSSNNLLKKQAEVSRILQSLQDEKLVLEQEKKTFCSLKRSESSCKQLKEDFRTGLKEFDDDEALQNDGENFDPDEDQRDYDMIDLPVFACSSRDYIFLNENNGSGQPACFSRIEDTGIPDLQKWCRQLPVTSRNRIVHTFLERLKNFASTVYTYVQSFNTDPALQDDREQLRRRWESITSDSLSKDRGSVPTDKHDIQPDWQQWYRDAVDTKVNVKVDVERDDPVPEAQLGISLQLTKAFKTLAHDQGGTLWTYLLSNLRKTCSAGAQKANSAAMKTCDDFAGPMNVQRYRKILEKLGCWQQWDFNEELLKPFHLHIAKTWMKVFKTHHFLSVDKVARNTISSVLDEIKRSAPLGLKEHLEDRKQVCLQEASIALQETLEVVRDTLNSEQKKGNRSLGLHIQGVLEDGYKDASQQRGRGSGLRQKAIFRDYLQAKRDKIFDGVLRNVMGRLFVVSTTVEQVLEKNLTALAEKIEVNVSEIWENTAGQNDPLRVKDRSAAIADMSEIVKQIQFWVEAEQRARDVAQAP